MLMFEKSGIRSKSSSGSATFVSTHKRRIKLEDKAKVVASVWGNRIFAVLAVLPRSIWNKRLSSNRRDDLCLAF